MEYAKKNNIMLKVNEKGKGDEYPLFYCVKNDNIEIINLLMKYTRENNIILDVNKGDYENNIDIGLTY